MSLSKMLQEYREGKREFPTYEELATLANDEPIVLKVENLAMHQVYDGDHWIEVAKEQYDRCNHACRRILPMTPERFAEKMDALDKANPAPLARLMAADEPCTDPIVERNVSMLRQRSTVGVQKYGTTLADNKLPLRAWLNHALEEALDQANYLQAAMAEIDSAATPQVITDDQAHEIMNSMAVHVDDWADGLNYEPSKTEVSGKALRYILSRTAAPVQPVAAPDGWKLVPVEPTDAMAIAAIEVPLGKLAINGVAQYRAMIAAAPVEQPEVRKPIMWAALNMDGKAVCANQDKQACDIERLCLKTPTTIVPLYAGAPEPQ